MKKIKDLTGRTFGKWKILKYNGVFYTRGNHKRHNWLCECQCENKTVKNVEHGKLLGGQSKSCIKCINKKYNTYDLSGKYGIGYLDNGYEFYFDLEDYDKIKDYCWHKHKDGYLRTKINQDENGKNIYILQHRLILQCEESIYEVDHINRIPYDNRKNNLILVEHIENMKNYGIYKNNISGVIGVFLFHERKHLESIYSI